VSEPGNESPDGRVDLRLNRDGELTLVQCKRWNIFKVGVDPVRELLGVMAAEGAERGIFVSTGTYTNAALRFAKDQPFELIDGVKLAEMLPASKHEKSDSATTQPTTATDSAQQSAPFRSHCSKCNGSMDLKKARKGKNAGRHFWGFSFPNMYRRAQRCLIISPAKPTVFVETFLSAKVGGSIMVPKQRTTKRLPEEPRNSWGLRCAIPLIIR
jgi:restriction system protein